MDAAGCGRVLLIGASEGGPGCIHFASRHPERLAGLVLCGSLAKGSWTPDYPFVLTHEQSDLWLRRLICDWGEEPAEIATFAPSLVGDAFCAPRRAPVRSRPCWSRCATPTFGRCCPASSRQRSSCIAAATARFASGPAGISPAQYGGRGWSSLMATITGSGPAISAAFWRRYAPSCAASKRADDRTTRCFAQRRKLALLNVSLLSA